MTVSPWMIDVIIVLIGIECVGVAILLRRLGRARLIGLAVSFLASGAALMVALRTALSRPADPMISVWLLVALVGHVVTLVLAAKHIQ
ncbi:MAG: hypothetical protein AAGJ29_09240 [Pseudomonadota bacterium]